MGDLIFSAWVSGAVPSQGTWTIKSVDYLWWLHVLHTVQIFKCTKRVLTTRISWASEMSTGKGDHALMCKQWWRVCWMYGDQEKFYRQLYGRQNGAGTAKVTRTQDAKKEDSVKLQRQLAYHDLYGLEPKPRRSSGDLPKNLGKVSLPLEVPTISAGVPIQKVPKLNGITPQVPSISAGVPMQRLPLLGTYPPDLGLPTIPNREYSSLPKKRLRNGETVTTVSTTTTTLTVQRLPSSQ